MLFSLFNTVPNILSLVKSGFLLVSVCFFQNSELRNLCFFETGVIGERIEYVGVLLVRGAAVARPRGAADPWHSQSASRHSSSAPLALIGRRARAAWRDGRTTLPALLYAELQDGRGHVEIGVAAVRRAR